MVVPVVNSKQVFCEYDCSDVLLGLNKIEDLMSGDKNDILRYAANELRKETDRAFASGVDPEDGPWPPRKHSYPWPILNNTGTLRGVVDFAWGVTKRDKSPRVFFKVKDVVYRQRSFRGGRLDAGFTYATPGQQHKSAMDVVTSVIYGRQKSRTTEGWRRRRTRHGYERKRKWSYGGGRGHDVAATGIVPPRPFMGFGDSALSRIKRFAQMNIVTAYRRAG